MIDDGAQTDLRLRIRLIKKLADSLDGVDVADVQVGECVELVPASARALILEGWAELADPSPVEAPVERPSIELPKRETPPAEIEIY